VLGRLIIEKYKLLRYVNLFSVFLIILVISCKQNQDKLLSLQIKEQLMLDNAEAFSNVNNLKVNNSILDTIISSDFIRNINGIEVASNPGELKASLNVYYIGFPDLELTNQFRVVKDNQIFSNWAITGTNTGVYGEIPATGKKIKITGFSHFYFNNDGIIYQEDIYYNELDLLQQLGYSITPPIVE